jgi:uncharacterized protein (DUF433 family)
MLFLLSSMFVRQIFPSPYHGLGSGRRSNTRRGSEPRKGALMAEIASFAVNAVVVIFFGFAAAHGLTHCLLLCSQTLRFLFEQGCTTRELIKADIQEWRRVFGENALGNRLPDNTFYPRQVASQERTGVTPPRKVSALRRPATRQLHTLRWSTLRCCAVFEEKRVSAENGMAMLDRITVEPGKMNAEPCIRGMRITVKRIVLAVATYGTGEALRRAYPDLDDEDIRQALEYAASNLRRSR